MKLFFKLNKFLFGKNKIDVLFYVTVFLTVKFS